jgi:hypothetical protein
MPQTNTRHRVANGSTQKVCLGVHPLAATTSLRPVVQRTNYHHIGFHNERLLHFKSVGNLFRHSDALYQVRMASKSAD